MAVALSPWPPATSAVVLQNARTCLRAAIGSDAADTVIDRLGGAASALVEAFASDAPQAVKDEATIRTAGYLDGVPHIGVTRMSVGAVDLVFDRDRTRAALRLSGAKALLAPWRSPGAAIAESS